MKPSKKQVFLAVALIFLTILSSFGWDDSSFNPEDFQDFQGFVDVPAGFEPAIPHPGYGFNDPAVNYQDIPVPQPPVSQPAPQLTPPHFDPYLPPTPQQQTNAYPPSFPDSRLQEMEHYAPPPQPPQYLPPQPPPFAPQQAPQSLGGDGQQLNYSGVEQNQMILDVRVIGHGQIPLEKVRQKVKSRPGRPYSELQVEEDKRALTQTGWFIDVKPNTYRAHDGITIIFELIERPLIHYVKFVGNKIHKKSKLLEESMIAPGDALDPMAVNQAKTRIEDFYKQGGHHKIHVEILSGDRLTDRGVVFLISEGRKQRIDRVQFIGCNSAISGARLKTQIKSKPGILYLIGGEFTREQLDRDVETLTEYYRNLGYFFAKVDRDFVEGRGYLGFGREDCWVTVRFIIEEGPRCRVSRLNITGNQVLSRKEILESMKKIKVGDYYNQQGLEGDIEKIKDLYGRQGRAFTEVDYDFIVDAPNPKTGVVELTLAIRESRLAQYGTVTVDIYDANGGNDPYTKTSTVQNRTPRVRPGALIDTQEIRNAERRLRYSQLFNSNPMQGYVPEVIFEVDDEKRQELFEDAPVIAGDLGVTRGQTQSMPPQIVHPASPNENRIQSILREEVKHMDQLLEHPTERGEQILRQRQQQNQQNQQQHQQQYQENPKGKRPTFTQNEQSEQPMLVLGQSRSVPTMPTATTNSGTSTGVTFGVGQQGITSVSANTTDVYGNTQSGTHNFNQNTVAPFEIPSENSQYGSVTSNYPPATDPAVSPYAPVTSTGPFGSSTFDVNAPPAPAPSTYDSGFAYNQPNHSNNRGGFLAPPQPYIPGPNNPSTQAGGLLGPVFPGSSGLDHQNTAFLNPKPQPIMTVPAKIRVMETMTGQFRASVGVNSDSGLVANFLYKEDNFNWRRPPRNPFRPEDWRNAFRGAGERFKIDASPGTKYQRYEVAWENPYFMNTDWSLGLSGFYYTRYYSEWRENRVGGTVSLGYLLTPDLSLSTYYKGESVRIYDPATLNVPDLNRVLGTNALHTFGLRLAHNTRDNEFLATEGHLFSFTAEQIVGSFQYPRLGADLRQYFMLHERPDSSGRWVLGFRSAAGWSDNDTPIFERYYAGGFTTLRGFDFRGVSPRYDWMAVGGNFEFYNSAELLFPITADDMIRGVVFVDTGCVQSRINEWDQKYRVAPGFGVRITIPFMGPAPIAFDFAFPVTKDPSDVTNMFSFYVGFMR